MTPIIEPFSALVLFGLGIGLLALEIGLGSFFVIWFGVGFLLVGVIELIYPFNEGIYQLVTGCVIALILLFAFAKRVRAMMQKTTQEISDDFLNKEGEGIIIEGMVSYKGTLWNYEPQDLELKDGDHVIVTKTKKSKAFVKKKP